MEIPPRQTDAVWSSQPPGGLERAQLASALRGLFDELGCSMRTFAASVFVDVSVVSRYLSGRRMPSQRFIQCLLEAVAQHRGGTPTSTEAKRIAHLHRLALEASAGPSAEIQLLRERLHRAELEVQRARAVLSPADANDRTATDAYWSVFSADPLVRSWDLSSGNWLSTTTARIMSCLPDASSEAARGSSGVVRTAPGHAMMLFGTGVVARALDAGYRLVVVLTGILNADRSRIQERIDSQLGLDGSRRIADVPPLLRLTTSEYDFRPVSHLQSLGFLEADATIPLYRPENLRRTMPRMLVMKQNASVMSKLISEVRASHSVLRDVPTLILDLYPHEPFWNGPLNSRIANLRSQLVDLLPRAQLIRFEDPYQLRPSDDPQLSVRRTTRSLWDGDPDFVISSIPRA